jgi:hypothetical protein
VNKIIKAPYLIFFIKSLIRNRNSIEINKFTN